MRTAGRSSRDGCAERAHDPPVLHHPRVRRLAAAAVASRGSAYLHVAAVTRFPLPALNLRRIAAFTERDSPA